MCECVCVSVSMVSAITSNKVFTKRYLRLQCNIGNTFIMVFFSKNTNMYMYVIYVFACICIYIYTVGVMKKLPLPL